MAITEMRDLGEDSYIEVSSISMSMIFFQFLLDESEKKSLKRKRRKIENCLALRRNANVQSGANLRRHPIFFQKGVHWPFTFEKYGAKVLADFKKGLFTENNFPVMARYLRGEPVKIHRNVLRVHAMKDFVDTSDDEFLKKCFKELVENWLSFTENCSIDFDSVQVKNKKDSLGAVSFDYVYSAVIQMRKVEELMWIPERFENPILPKDVPEKLLYSSLMFYGDKLCLYENDGEDVLFCRPKTRSDLERFIDYSVGSSNGKITKEIRFFEFIELVSEMSNSAKNRDVLEMVKNCSEKNDLIMPVLNMGFRTTEIDMKRLEKMIYSAEKFSQYLKASQEFLTRYAKETEQEGANNIELKNFSSAIMDRIAIDPILYLEHWLPCVSFSAKQVFSGNIDLSK